MLPQEFVEKWKNVPLNERQVVQSHFLDVCQLVGHELPSPTGLTSKGQRFVFEQSLKKEDGGQGYADVWYEGHFAIEYKGVGKDLDAAYQQLLQYRENLHNPPLLVVCDIEHWRIHTNFPNTEKLVIEIAHHELTLESKLKQIRALFDAPESLHPRRNTEQVTQDAARAFEIIANNMRQWKAEPARIARFLTKLVFCLFAEDVSLLPAGPRGDIGIFSEIVEQTRTTPSQFTNYMHGLFEAMKDGGHILFKEIPWFNGSLFEDVQVEELSLEALTALESAARLNWSSVEPAIFGTLFERSLDPNKRAQLGAHYTSRDDIMLIVEPVLMEPLRRQWRAIIDQSAPIREKYEAADTPRTQHEQQQKLDALRAEMLASLRSVTVLDPACGSGNFLYVALGLLLDMEKAVINHPLFDVLPVQTPQVHPRQMNGIEIDEIAHDLASIVVWIGYIQWKQNNGYPHFDQPILEDLYHNIRLMDAILAYDAEGKPIEPEWQAVDVIVGNPPFLGGQRLRSELGNEYLEQIWHVYTDRIPGSADLVTYWFESARRQIEHHKAKRAGLLSTNSIRGGANRDVLKRIKDSGDIFMAWSDREWILEGAAVRVSMIGFDDGTEAEKSLDGLPVSTINADLTASIDITVAKKITQNQTLAFQGPVKVGAFDIPDSIARPMLQKANKNSEVIRPYMNGDDIVKHNRGYWLIDFGMRTEVESSAYHAPFSYVEKQVKPTRLNNKDRQRREYWWRLGRSGEDYKQAILGLKRQIFTPRVAKHRVYVWIDSNVMPSDALVAIARDDDYFFGVLHSRLHEVWSLRMGTWLGKGNDPRYTPTTTFETFPFPWSPGAEDVDSPHYQAIASAARQLHEERDAWLNPPGVTGKGLKDRTLTNLYNALNVFRGVEKIKTKQAAGDFAPRLHELHRALDAAVCAAYGWDIAVLDDEESILGELLALNLARS